LQITAPVHKTQMLNDQQSTDNRLSLIIATLGPSTDNEKELITMLMAGIARQWTDGVDIARVLHSDGEEVAKKQN